MEYNIRNNIVPTTVQKGIRDVLETMKVAEADAGYAFIGNVQELDEKDLQAVILKLEKEMKEAARELQFERAAALRDRLRELKDESKR